MKESNHHSDLDAIPGVQERWLTRGSPEGKQPGAEGVDDSEAKRIRADAVAPD